MSYILHIIYFLLNPMVNFKFCQIFEHFFCNIQTLDKLQTATQPFNIFTSIYLFQFLTNDESSGKNAYRFM